jgi:PAS domain S-box-containing protein
MNTTNQPIVAPVPGQALDSNQQLVLLKSILESSTEYSIVASDLDGTILVWNEGAWRNYGYEPEEMVGKASIFILNPVEEVDSGRARSVLDVARQAGKWEGELPRVRKDGSRFTAHAAVTLRRDPDGQPLGFTMISRDLTAAQRIERELRESQEYNRGLIESNIDALMTTDPLGVISDVNKQMCAMSGRSREELIGTLFKNYFTEPQRAEDGIRKVLAEDRVTNYELTMVHQDGKRTVVSYNATTFRSADSAACLPPPATSPNRSVSRSSSAARTRNWRSRTAAFRAPTASRASSSPTCPTSFARRLTESSASPS